MEAMGVEMRRHDHLKIRPQLLCQRHADFMRRVCVHLAFDKGLIPMPCKNPVHFVVPALSHLHLLSGVVGIAV